jgi:hypothetical protein
MAQSGGTLAQFRSTNEGVWGLHDIVEASRPKEREGVLRSTSEPLLLSSDTIR